MLVMEIREMLRVANWADSVQPISGVAGYTEILKHDVISRDSRMNMRHDLQYYYNYIIRQGTLLAKNKEQCTTQQILTTTTTISKSMENSYLNLTVRILQQNDSCYTDKQCDKCMSLEGRNEN